MCTELAWLCQAVGRVKQVLCSEQPLCYQVHSPVLLWAAVQVAEEDVTTWNDGTKAVERSIKQRIGVLTLKDTRAAVSDEAASEVIIAMLRWATLHLASSESHSICAVTGPQQMMMGICIEQA